MMVVLGRTRRDVHYCSYSGFHGTWYHCSRQEQRLSSLNKNYHTYSTCRHPNVTHLVMLVRLKEESGSFPPKYTERRVVLCSLVVLPCFHFMSAVGQNHRRPPFERCCQTRWRNATDSGSSLLPPYHAARLSQYHVSNRPSHSSTYYGTLPYTYICPYILFIHIIMIILPHVAGRGCSSRVPRDRGDMGIVLIPSVENMRTPFPRNRTPNKIGSTCFSCIQELRQSMLRSLNRKTFSIIIDEQSLQWRMPMLSL